MERIYRVYDSKNQLVVSVDIDTYAEFTLEDSKFEGDGQPSLLSFKEGLELIDKTQYIAWDSKEDFTLNIIQYLGLSEFVDSKYEIEMPTWTNNLQLQLSQDTTEFVPNANPSYTAIYTEKEGNPSAIQSDDLADDDYFVIYRINLETRSGILPLPKPLGNKNKTFIWVQDTKKPVNFMIGMES